MRNSDLELCVLGTIWAHGPCTPYRVRKVFNSSLSAQWKCGTGSIYPVVQRLKKKRLIKAKRKRDGRAAVELSVNAKGQAELRRWLSQPLPAGEELMGFDPLRARIRYLEILSESEKVSFLAEAVASLKSQRKKVNQLLGAHSKGDAESLVFRGAYLSLNAQINWLQEILRSLE